MKKILSIILAVAMLLALCPAVFAADTVDEFTGYEYVFSEDVIPEDGFDRYTDGQILQATLASMTLDTPISSLSDRWKLASANKVTSTLMTGYFKLEATRTNGESCFAIKLKVDEGGTYLPKLTYARSSQGGIVDIYLVKEEMDFYVSSTVHPNTSDLDNPESLGSQNCSATYNVPYYFNRGFPAGTPGAYVLKTDLDMYTGSGSDTVEDFGKRELTLKDNTSYYLIFRIKNAHQDVIDAGKRWYCLLKSFSLTPVQDEKLTEAFKPDSVPAEDYSEAAVISITKDGQRIESVKNADGTHNITAPEKNGKGAKFLYWAKGLSAQKRILIGETNVLKNYVPDAEYANYLIPVYEDEVSGTEYYNANGQLIPDAKESDRPSMAGYGTATGWDKYDDTNIYVAHYDLEKPEKNIDVTVTNGTGTGTYAFGDTVTCRATGTGTFKCWTKSEIHGASEPEIVSVDETYKFKAWEDCTVTAVYEDHHYTGNTMKIIIDTFDVATGVTGVMAEFIGLDNAVEKGIMFTDSERNTTKIAMTTKDNQFTVIADETGTYKGYAIIKNTGDNGYTLITDGEYGK